MAYGTPYVLPPKVTPETAESKNRILAECGINVAKSVAEIGNIMKESLTQNV